jgi:cobalt/nickel transport system permease protein
VLTLAAQDSPIHRLDPRLRLAVALAWAVAVATAGRSWGLVCALAFGAALCIAARIPAGLLVRRLAQLNVFMAVLVGVLPWSHAGPPLFELAGAGYSAAGLVRALEIAGRANAILLVLSALVSTMDAITLGHVLDAWRLPRKLTRLLFFTARYLDLLHGESARMRRALAARAFEPRLGVRTLRVRAYQAGLLLVRAHDRAERVLAAMRCRGFAGVFPAFRRFRLQPRDGWFAMAAGIALAVALWASVR